MNVTLPILLFPSSGRGREEGRNLKKYNFRIDSRFLLMISSKFSFKLCPEKVSLYPMFVHYMEVYTCMS